MFRQTSERQTNAQTQARQRNEQMVECAGKRSLPKQQKICTSSKVRNNAKDNVDLKIKRLIFTTPEYRENLDSFSIAIFYAARNTPNRMICKTAPNSSYGSSVQNVQPFHVIVLRPFVNNGKEINKKIAMHAQTTIVLVAVAVKVCSIKLLNTK